MSHNVGVLGKCYWGFRSVHQVIRIDAVNHVNMMPLIAERMGEPVDLHGVAAKAVGRVKRGELEKIERSAHATATLPITVIIWRAASSQDKRAAAASPEARMRDRKSLEASTFSRARAMSSAPVSI